MSLPVRTSHVSIQELVNAVLTMYSRDLCKCTVTASCLFPELEYIRRVFSLYVDELTQI